MIAKHRILTILVLSTLLTATLIGVVPRAFAQVSEPTGIIDAALRDLSQKLGRTLTRNNVDNWTWEQVQFPDASLGCPQPGQTYAQVLTLGFKFTFTVGGVVYDYRALNDGSRIFQCTASGAVPAGPTPTREAAPPTVAPIAPVAPGQPMAFQKSLAYVRADGNVSITAIGQGAGIPITGDASVQTLQTMPFYDVTRQYGQFHWSPDGTKLIFTEQRSQSLYLAVSGQAPVQIARGLSTLYPGAWSPDGTEIAYAVETNQQQGEGLVRQVQAVPVTATGASQPRVAGSFVQRVGCGGGVSDPAEMIYQDEAGFGGNPLTLDWTTQGFVYSMECTGVGLALADPGGRVLWKLDNVARADISPDRTRAVALRRNVQGQQSGMVSIDLRNGSATQIHSEANPDQVAWSADGSTIIYSTLVAAPGIQGNPQSAVGQQLFQGEWPVDSKSNTVTLWRMPAAGGQSTRLFQGEGRGVGVIASAPDNSGVAFSLVSSMAVMIQQINNGATVSQVLGALPHADVLFVNWDGGGQPAAVVRGGRPAFGGGTFTAVPSGANTVNVPQGGSPGGDPNVPPPNLVIGGTAVVSTTRGDTLNLRKSPSISAPVLRILKPGAVVTILAGPQSADGFRWWQVRAQDDNSVGWVVDQVTDQDGTTNTLTPQ